MFEIFTSAGPLAFFIVFGSLVISITVHEFAHAFAADKLGDPTPRVQGRLSLNPLAHLDPLGTIMILIAWFGWGKPVMFDPYNLKNPRRDAAFIGLAGPVSNFILATLLSILLRILPLPPLIQLVFVYIIYLNLILGIFNLIPIHPLDGGKILIGFLPKNLALEWNAVLNQYGMLILIFLIFPFTGRSPISLLISPIINILLSLLLPGSPLGILT
jgi:Zn-dependent protease